ETLPFGLVFMPVCPFAPWARRVDHDRDAGRARVQLQHRKELEAGGVVHLQTHNHQAGLHALDERVGMAGRFNAHDDVVTCIHKETERLLKWTFADDDDVPESASGRKGLGTGDASMTGLRS